MQMQVKSVKCAQKSLFIISSLQKNTKSSLETTLTIATLLADPSLRNCLLAVRSGAETREVLRAAAKQLAEQPPPQLRNALASRGSILSRSSKANGARAHQQSRENTRDRRF